MQVVKILSQAVNIVSGASTPAAKGALSASIVPALDALLIGEVPEKKISALHARDWSVAQRKLDAKIRVVSYNILFDRYDHQLEPKHRWPVRASRVLQALKSFDADIIGLQEVMHSQATDICAALADRYAFYAQGTTDGKFKGEMNGILYRKERFQLEEQATIWCSETPDRPSDDPVGGGRTALTVMRLNDQRSARSFYVINSHFPFFRRGHGVEARDYCAKVVGKLVEVLEKDVPVIMTGDLNSFPALVDKDLPFYDGDRLLDTLALAGLVDSQYAALIGHIGPQATYTNDPEGSKDKKAFAGTGTPGVYLDHVLVKDACALAHAVDPVRVDGEFPSDHMPVIVDLVLN
jgi:endonuclease/exonuclease/phosphatase family metal-dependent hydrolase